MNDRIRRLYESYLRVSAFMSGNATDFQSVPFVAATVAALQTETDTIANLGAVKATATAASKDSFIFKGDARDSLRDYLEYVAEVWRTAFDEVTDGGENKFRVPSGTNDQNLIAAGKSFAADAVGYRQVFLDHGLPADFISEIEAKTAAFEQTVTTASAAYGERIGTNAAFDEPARRAKNLTEKLAPIVKRRYRDNPQKLAAWLIASHIERPSKMAKKEALPNGENK